MGGGGVPLLFSGLRLWSEVLVYKGSVRALIVLWGFGGLGMLLRSLRVEGFGLGVGPKSQECLGCGEIECSGLLS